MLYSGSEINKCWIEFVVHEIEKISFLKRYPNNLYFQGCMAFLRSMFNSLSTIQTCEQLKQLATDLSKAVILVQFLLYYLE